MGCATDESLGLRQWHHQHRHQLLRAEPGAAVSAEGPGRRDVLLDGRVRFRPRQSAPRAPPLQQQTGHAALLLRQNQRAHAANQQNLWHFHPAAADLPQFVLPAGGFRHIEEFVQLAAVQCKVRPWRLEILLLDERRRWENCDLFHNFGIVRQRMQKTQDYLVSLHQQADVVQVAGISMTHA